MTSNAQEAVALFQEGYNCAQAVFAAGVRPYGLAKETALRVGQAFQQRGALFALQGVIAGGSVQHAIEIRARH